MDAAILELLASRICHDLISPVGAVHNGVEFLEEMGIDAGEDAIQLIAHSAQQAAAKLQVFRLAYGAGGRDPNINPKDIKQAFADLIDADGKVSQDWDAYALETDDLPLGFCKILMGALMLAQESLPKGGTVKVSRNGPRVEILSEGPGAVPRPRTGEALARSLSPEDLDPRLVHPFALSALADGYGMALTIGEQNEGRVVYYLQKQ